MGDRLTIYYSEFQSGLKFTWVHQVSVLTDRDSVLFFFLLLFTPTECKTSRQSERKKKTVDCCQLASKQAERYQVGKVNIWAWPRVKCVCVSTKQKEALHGSKVNRDGSWYPVTLINVVLCLNLMRTATCKVYQLYSAKFKCSDYGVIWNLLWPAAK